MKFHQTVSTQSTSISSPLPIWRSRLVVFILFILFSSLLLRGLWIQWFNNAFYEEQSKIRTERSLPIPAFRGKILDRNNNNLATSLNTKTIWADPSYMNRLEKCKTLLQPKLDENCRNTLDLKLLKQQEEKLPKLASLLDMNIEDIKNKISKNKLGFIYIKRQVDLVTARKIKDLNLVGFYQLIEPKRYYTQGEVTAQLLGITDIEDRGQEGIELAFNKSLAGKYGQRKVTKDRLNRVVDELGVIKPPIHGKDLVLSIDAHLQTEVYNALKEAVQANKAKLGTAVVLDAKTGETLAIANWPSYNPNIKVANVFEASRKNHALTDTFEPGSTMKPLTIAAALEKGAIKSNTVFNTSSIVVGSKSVSDSHHYPHLDTLGILQKSSNIGTVKISMMLSSEEQWNMYRQVGLGQTPDVDFPGSASGRLRNFKSWKPVEKATMAYGYGLSASIFQLAQAYTIFANEGKFIPATLYKRDLSEITPKQVISKQTNDVVLKGLEMVTQAGGTAPQAQIAGYRTGGKTGTAHKQVGKGYASNIYRAFFTGLAPMSDPKIIVSVMVDEPSNGTYYGGTVAAPIFARVAEVSLRVLNIPMDKAVEIPKNNKDKKIPAPTH